MAKPERQLILALANVRPAPWPTQLPDLGVPALAPLPEVPLLTADESMRLGLVRSHRRTCELDAARLDRFIASPAPRTLIIHAVDAEPAVPLLAMWMLRHVEAIASLGAHLAREFSCEVLFARSTELPEAQRRQLTALRPTITVDGHYPGGYWRLMPRAARQSAARTLVIDAVAATDWIEAMTTGSAAQSRPIAVAAEGRSLLYRTVSRGTRIDSLAGESGDEPARWFAGPRLADAQISDGETVGDGELTFYREPRGDRSSSACIRCGACIAICPTRCDPVALLRAHIADPSHTRHHERQLRRAGLDACIECGLCTATCPSKIELHHAIIDLRSSRAEPAHD